MSAEFMVICKKILFRNCVIVSLFVFTYNTWAQCNNNIKIMRKYESEGKYTVRNLVKNKAIALELRYMLRIVMDRMPQKKKNHTKSLS